MIIDAAINLLGTAEPWHVVRKSDFVGYRSDDDSAVEDPWFVMNRQETIQFRVICKTIDAVILRPEEIDDYDQLEKLLTARGFRIEQPRNRGAVDDEVQYVSDRVRVSIPTTADRSPGFACAVTFKRIRRDG